MFIEVKQVPPEGQTFERELSPETLPAQEEGRLVDRALISGRLTPVEDEGICLLGHLQAKVEIACVRCLDLFVMEVDEDLDLLFLPQSANVGPGNGKDEERELTENDLAVSFYSGDRIDLSQVLWEQVSFAIPMKPLCKEDCLGLCPECGTNLNHSKCSCDRDTVDPRLASLKKLLEP